MSKTALISERIAILEGKLGKSGNVLGKEAGIGNGTVGGWSDNQIEKPTAVVEKFLTYYNIRTEWWKTGKGEIFNTSVQERSDNTEKPLNDNPKVLLQKIVFGDTEYVIMPKTAFDGNYRLMPVEEITMHEKELERRNDELVRKDEQIMGLYELFKLMASGSPQLPPAIKDTKKKAGV